MEKPPTSRTGLVAWLRAPIVALTFLTILPVGKRITVSDDELPRAIGFFPLIGLLLGLATAGVSMALSSRMTPMLGAIVATAWMALVTGALHLDGVGDLSDAVAGGRGDRKRALEILRDPGMGSAGTVALVLVLMMQIAATARIIESAEWTVLVVAPLVSRALIVPVVALFPSARDNGRAYAFATGARSGRVAIVVALGIVVPVMVVAYPGVVPLCASFLATVAVVLIGRSVLGGMTGDVYGAAIVLSEVAFLAASAP